MFYSFSTRPIRLKWATACAIFGIIGASSCRKAEPDEVVSAPRRPTVTAPSTSKGGSNAVDTGAGGADAGGATLSEAGAGGGNGGSSGVADLHCGNSPSIQLEGPFTKKTLLESVASCALHHYCQFAAAADRLRFAAVAYSTHGSAENENAAKRAWLDALAIWQKAELFRFGPAAAAPEGQDLRNRIYSWPRDVRCKIDEQTVSRFYATSEFSGSPSESFVTGRSLAALEYLLFYTGTDNGCTQYSAINANGAWAALSESELKQRKAEYAAAAAEDLLNSSILLVRAWDPNYGNFYGQLSAPGTGSSPFADEQSAFNAINHGLFYLEQEVKDWKLAIPMGLSLECPAVNCPERVESRFAGQSVKGLANRHLQANLVGFRQLFQGCGENGAGFGFDDWLRAAGATELADRMVGAIDVADAAVAGLGIPLEEAVAKHPELVMVIYDAIKAITDPLKSEFLSVLNLSVPTASETDND